MKFFAETGFPAPWNTDWFLGAVRAGINSGDMRVAIREEGGRLAGAIGAIKSRSLFSDAPFWSKAFWNSFEDKRSGGNVKLLEMIEGVARMERMPLVMSALDNEHMKAMARLYRMRGYRPLEHIHVKGA